MKALATTKKKPVGQPLYDRAVVSAEVFKLLSEGKSLTWICKQPGMPQSSTFLDWIEEDPALAEQYARARERGYALLADELIAISDETDTEVEVQETDAEGNPLVRADGSPVLKRVRVPLSSDVIARNRLRVDTRKWMLSKMLPKVYGEKVTQEVTGKDGAPLVLNAVNFKTLTDAELETMQKMLAKAAAQSDVIDVEAKERR